MLHYKVHNLKRWEWWEKFCKVNKLDPWMKEYQGKEYKKMRRRQQFFMDFAKFVRDGCCHNGHKVKYKTVDSALRDCGYILEVHAYENPRKAIKHSRLTDYPIRKIISQYRQEDEAEVLKEKYELVKLCKKT